MRSFAAGFLAIDFSLYLYNVLKMSVFHVGVILAIGAFATPVISLLVGFLGDKYGRKPVLIFDLLTLPIGLAIIVVNHSLTAIAIASALGGFGVAGGLVGGGVGASVGPVVTTLLAENTNERNRTLIFSINTALSTFTGAAGALMVSFFSYEPLFLLGIAITLISVLLIIPLEEIYSRPQRGSGISSLSDRDKKFIKAFGLTGLINGMSQGLITPFYPLIFEVFFHFTVAQVGYLMTIGGLATGVVDLFSSWFAGRLGFLKLIIVTRAISATMVLALP
ncbi:MAG TPA: MFS transporter, partial [Thermoprotei archaeon]|nr:MFS transporter [Thermoprotei archaeon]